MQTIRRLLHDLTNALTCVQGFLDLAAGEPDRTIRHGYMIRARRELTRSVDIVVRMRAEVECKAAQYDESPYDD
jgi:hypothetical protein